MSTEIERGGKWVRPSFSYYDHPNTTPTQDCIAQVLESLRNVAEDQALNIKRIERSVSRLDVTLRRIDRRLATRIKIRGHK